LFFYGNITGIPTSMYNILYVLHLTEFTPQRAQASPAGTTPLCYLGPANGMYVYNVLQCLSHYCILLQAV